MPDRRLTHAAEMLKSLAHPARLRTVAMLQDGPLSVCQIIAVLHLAPSTVSAHLADLRHAGLSTNHKSGRFVTYELAEDAVTTRLLASLSAWLEPDEQVREDRRLAGLLRELGAPSLCASGLDLEKAGIEGAGLSAAPTDTAPKETS